MDLVPTGNPTGRDTLREIQPNPGLDLGRPTGPQIYPQPPVHESAIGEYWHILRKHWWIVAACVATIFSVVTIASFKQPKVYEASGTIAINKPDISLNFQNTATFSLDYYDPSELETEVKILQSDVLALEVIRSLNLDQRPEFGGQISNSPSADLAPDPLQSDPGKAASLLGGFKGNLRVSLSQNSRIIEVHYRSAEPDTAANVVNALMQTYIQDNLKARFESTMTASDWLKKQLVDLQMKVETSQEKLVRYQKEHEILGIDEKQNIITSKLDELNRELTLAESERMQKESLYHLVQSEDLETVAAAATSVESDRGSTAGGSFLLEKLREQDAD